MGGCEWDTHRSLNELDVQSIEYIFNLTHNSQFMHEK